MLNLKLLRLFIEAMILRVQVKNRDLKEFQSNRQRAMTMKALSLMTFNQKLKTPKSLQKRMARAKQLNLKDSSKLKAST